MNRNGIFNTSILDLFLQDTAKGVRYSTVIESVFAACNRYSEFFDSLDILSKRDAFLQFHQVTRTITKINSIVQSNLVSNCIKH